MSTNHFSDVLNKINESYFLILYVKSETARLHYISKGISPGIIVSLIE